MREHIAFLDKKRKLLDKILSGEKTIESRWYVTRRPPYNSISPGERVYFKDAGEPVTARATVSRVLFFDALDEAKVRGIIETYGDAICLSPGSREDLRWAAGKKYCILVFLRDAQRVPPFRIDKRGFGMMAAWITVPSVASLRRQ